VAQYIDELLAHSMRSTTLDICRYLIPDIQEETALIMDEFITAIPIGILTVFVPLRVVSYVSKRACSAK